jgi:hypothetical protein
MQCCIFCPILFEPSTMASPAAALEHKLFSQQLLLTFEYPQQKNWARKTSSSSCRSININALLVTSVCCVFQLWGIDRQEYKRNIINDFSNGNFVGYIVELIWISFYEAIKQDLSKEGLTPSSCSYTLGIFGKAGWISLYSFYLDTVLLTCVFFSSGCAFAE